MLLILLAANTSSATNIYDDLVVFSIDLSDTAILLKPWMNCQ